MRTQGWSMELRCADALWAPLAWYRHKDDAYDSMHHYRERFPASSVRLVSAPIPLTFREEIPPCLVCGEYGAHMPGCAVTETD